MGLIKLCVLIEANVQSFEHHFSDLQAVQPLLVTKNTMNGASAFVDEYFWTKIFMLKTFAGEYRITSYDSFTKS